MNFRTCILNAMYTDIDLHTIPIGNRILKYLGWDKIEPEQVYEVATLNRELNDIHIGNIHLELQHKRIVVALFNSNNSMNITVEIDGKNSKYFIDGELLKSFSQFKRVFLQSNNFG